MPFSPSFLPPYAFSRVLTWRCFRTAVYFLVFLVHAEKRPSLVFNLVTTRRGHLILAVILEVEVMPIAFMIHSLDRKSPVSSFWRPSRLSTFGRIFQNFRFYEYPCYCGERKISLTLTYQYTLRKGGKEGGKRVGQGALPQELRVRSMSSFSDRCRHFFCV